jgi:uncharacterized protein YceK
MRQCFVAVLVLAMSVAGCSTVSTTTPSTTSTSASAAGLPTFADTDAVRLTDAERAAVVRDAGARVIDPKRPLVDVPGGVVDTRTGTRYACANFYGRKSQGGNPVPITVAGRFEGTSFAVISVGVEDNRKTWEICNKLGVNIDWRAYE